MQPVKAEATAPAKELAALVAKCGTEKPGADDIKALAIYLQQHGRGDLAKIGDLSHRLTNIIIDKSFKRNYGFALAVGEKCNEIENSLGYAESPPLERMLIRHICICWLRLYDTELHFESIPSEQQTIDRIEHWERRLSAAQRRYLRSIEVLSRVRKLAVTVQVNLAQNQVVMT